MNICDKSRSHYSSLNQVNTKNVKSLKKIWEYKSGGIQNSKNTTQIQCSPIVVDTILYGTNPLTKLLQSMQKLEKKYGNLITVRTLVQAGGVSTED